MKFDFVIGNPPYQDIISEESDNKTYAAPVYNMFMDEAATIADKAELIHPARFLFNAGATPKAWNEKMLADEHFKVLQYSENAADVFPNTDIKGGLVISYRDATKNYDPIGIFTKYDELNTILHKVKVKNEKSFDTIIASTMSYGVTSLFVKEHPHLVNRLRTSAFTVLAEVFFDEKPNDGYEYILMAGLKNMKRTRMYVRKDYIKDKDGTLDYYTVLMPAASGSGKFGETLSATDIAEPGVGFLQTFIGIGKYDTLEPCKNIQKYIKCKFTRTLLGVLKITQHCTGQAWSCVPLQDFTSSSDIDWSQSIANIDKQLYKKYNLSDEEINFIETNVR
ncbi:Eco57I restriction endonuclease [Coprococcus catus GD/7]|uniref:Eco57I restriction endonuclease n=1 Tax=Coprococcus catus GD/7 TaxID=717962 RepID=D4J8Z1_9FIRM|nr:Eco57I restriction-modification methylase domain-containing protein [Coprococcus catus]CBK80812.1 Eco57I restriction endonuclease [Coprococcus catus GD/7]